MPLYPFHNGPFHEQRIVVPEGMDKVYFLFSREPATRDVTEMQAYFYEYFRQAYRGSGRFNVGYVYGGIVGPVAITVHHPGAGAVVTPPVPARIDEEMAREIVADVLEKQQERLEQEVFFGNHPTQSRESAIVAPKRPRGRPRSVARA